MSEFEIEATPLTEKVPGFCFDKHVEYIKKVASDTKSFEFVVTQHLRMSGVYWGTTAMSLLGKDLKTEMDSDKIVEWVLTCHDDKTGG
jgi:geranylgeranyl transferase type-2 subunit beta